MHAKRDQIVRLFSYRVEPGLSKVNLLVIVMVTVIVIEIEIL